MKSNRGLTLDFTRVGDVKQIPNEGFEDLADAFQLVTDEREWPLNNTPIPIGLHRKPAGGDRPIGITPVFSALYIKTHINTIDEREIEHMNFWEYHFPE